MGNHAFPSLHYQSLEELKGIRQKEARQAPCDELQRVIDDVPFALNELFPDETGTSTFTSSPSSLPQSWQSQTLNDADSTRRQREFGRIAMALVLLGHGYTDECHNLITPMSWPDDIHFAHGPSTYGTTSVPARTFATYTHALVHRKEAFRQGEFGMIGFANANFWSNAVAKCPDDDDVLPQDELRDAVIGLSQRPQYVGVGSIQTWCQDHGLVSGDDASSNMYFESRAVHELCATALRLSQQTNAGSASDATTEEDRKLISFAEEVVRDEIQILLLSALQNAGYDVDALLQQLGSSSNARTVASNTSSQAHTGSRWHIDEDFALSATRKVSAAHIHSFQTNKCIVMRRIVAQDLANVNSINNDDPYPTSLLISAATSMVCRLLGVPACRMIENESGTAAASVNQDSHAIVQIIVALEELAGLELGQFDCHVQLLDGELETSGAKGSADDECRRLAFQLQACGVDDDHALFVDKLYGTRGETPTTVVQWSKGTVF